MATALVIIPTYNEKENIRNIISAVLAQSEPFHILIVDDNSPDKTGDIVAGLIPEYEGRLHLLSRASKEGLGKAYIAGFKWGLDRGYKFLFEMDADFSHNPVDLLRLLDACRHDGADAAVGSRYVKGGKVVNWPFNRLFLSYGASLYVRALTWMPFKDPTAGFICYNSDVLKAIDLDSIEFVGYAFQIEMKYAVHKLGFKIVEVPITFTERTEGTSKMHKSIIKEAIQGVFRMRFSKGKSTYDRRI